MIDKPVVGVQTDTRPHPAGAEGARLSLKEVAERAWKARMSPRLRAWVTQQLDKCGASREGRRSQAQCILDAFRKKVPYIADPLMGEFMATPDQLLCLDEGGLCIMGGDCFPEGTLLLRDDFEFTPIERIKVGDRIWGKDKWSTVTQKWAKGALEVDAIKMSNGSTVHLTANHKVYVGECKQAQNSIEAAHNDMAVIKEVERIEAFDRRIPVRDLKGGDTLLQPQRIRVCRTSSPWSVEQREKHGLSLFVRSIDCAVRTVPCWDIATDDHYVYLPEHDVTVSNCDEATITLLAALMSIAIPTMVIGSSHREPYDLPTHVFGAFKDDLGDWVRLDGTTQYPVGRVVPRVREWWVEPGKEAKESGEGDFVGMSGSLNRPATLLDLVYPGIR